MTEAPALRVVLVDDHPLMLEALAATMAEADSITVAGTASNGHDALKLLNDNGNVDVVLTDFQMPQMNGLELSDKITGQYDDVAVVLLTSYERPGLILEAIEAGAAGVILKTVDAAEVAELIRAAADGRAAMDREAVDHLVEEVRKYVVTGRRPGPSLLSDREGEVLSKAAEGMTNVQIARALDISPQTVKTHLARTYRKLEVHDRAAAVAVALQQGMM